MEKKQYGKSDALPCLNPSPQAMTSFIDDPSVISEKVFRSKILRPTYV
jgi:hypothetical protein